MKTKALIGLFCSALLTLSTMGDALAQGKKSDNYKNQNKNCPVQDSTCQGPQNCPTSNSCPQDCPYPAEGQPANCPNYSKHQNGNCSPCPANYQNPKPGKKPAEQKK